MNINKDEFKEVDFKFEALNNCPLCDKEVMLPNGKICWLNVDFWYVVCPNCGLKFMNPRPNQESYRDFYKNKFWQQKIRNLGFHQTGQAWQTSKYKWDNEEEWDPEFGIKNLSDKTKELRVGGIIDVLQQHIALNNTVDILEVGCAFPVTLQALKRWHNCNVFAIEPSDEIQKIIQEDKDIFLIGNYAEDLEEISRQSRKFDVIIFSHALENTTNPVSIIKHAKASLKENGFIYIQTPNLLVYDQMNPYHPYIFSSQSLKFMTDKCQLRYKKISPTIDRMLVALFFMK